MWGDSEFKRISKPTAEFEANNAKRHVEMNVKTRGGNPCDTWAGEEAYAHTMGRHGFHQTWTPPDFPNVNEQFKLSSVEYDANNARRQAEMDVIIRRGDSHEAYEAGEEAYDRTMLRHGYYKTWE